MLKSVDCVAVFSLQWRVEKTHLIVLVVLFEQTCDDILNIALKAIENRKRAIPPPINVIFSIYLQPFCSTLDMRMKKKTYTRITLGKRLQTQINPVHCSCCKLIPVSGYFQSNQITFTLMVFSTHSQIQQRQIIF